MIKDCPKWLNIKAKDKREKAKLQHQKVMLAAVWGDFESEEEEEANICLSTLKLDESNSLDLVPRNLCLMGKSNSPDSEEDIELSYSLLRKHVKTLPRKKMISYFEEILDTCHNQELEIHDLKFHINDIAEENDVMTMKLKGPREKVKTTIIESNTKPVLIQTPTTDLKREYDYLTKRNSSLVSQMKKLRSENNKLKSTSDLNKENDSFVNKIQQLSIELEKAKK